MKILILSDIHANLPALEAVLATEPKWDALFFLGDVVDYGPEPKPCLDFIRQRADFYVRGNHDHALAYDADCGCRSDFRPMSVATRQWHRTLLRENDLHFLQRLPIIHSTIADGKNFWLAHASPSGDLTCYMNAEEVIAASADIDADVILVGHTHLPFLREVEGKIFCNPGSVGLARDRGGEACYAVWENGRLMLKRTAYDVSATIARLEQSPLDNEIVEALRKVLKKK
ncbi:MAG: metallophosphatase family protein [candidate division KSB1 bacterium]|nr:metallophosphatase family protein [candidate division KSB1 bacterium]MDZ7302179.1 metallophosphatase family protein [candidate division KSB1 bacterium]MDZ7311288.1 metallophosphatase family protein [candidate division KSB1 bacterium]